MAGYWKWLFKRFGEIRKPRFGAFAEYFIGAMLCLFSAGAILYILLIELFIGCLFIGYISYLVLSTIVGFILCTHGIYRRFENKGFIQD